MKNRLTGKELREMKCPNCGFESEGRFCPECGTPLAEMTVSTEKVCPECGELTDSKFCPNCGHNMNASEETILQGTPAFAEDSGAANEGPFGNQGGDLRWSGITPDVPQKKSYRKLIISIILAIAAVLVAAIIAIAVIARGVTDNYSDWDSDTNPSTSEELFSDDEEEDADEIAEVEKQGKELPGGSYLVGEDIAAGKYNFTYTTEMTEDDYWSNDYFYITRAGSEGTEETLGGTKFDERFGSVEYNSAKAGKNFYANLKKGDKLQVNSEYGNWTY